MNSPQFVYLNRQRYFVEVLLQLTISSGEDHIQSSLVWQLLKLRALWRVLAYFAMLWRESVGQVHPNISPLSQSYGYIVLKMSPTRGILGP